jgi:hypothetical protein
MAVKCYQELKPDPSALDAFIKQQESMIPKTIEVSIITNTFLTYLPSFQNTVTLRCWVSSRDA